MKIINQIKNFTSLANRVLDRITNQLAEKHRIHEATTLLSYAKLANNTDFANELIADGAIEQKNYNLQSMRDKVFSKTTKVKNFLKQQM